MNIWLFQFDIERISMIINIYKNESRYPTDKREHLYAFSVLPSTCLLLWNNVLPKKTIMLVWMSKNTKH